MICFHVWSMSIKFLGKRTSALIFASVQISNVKHSTVLSMIYHDKMNTMEQASTIFLMSIFIWWNRVGQSLGWTLQQVTTSRQANARPELLWPSFPIQIFLGYFFPLIISPPPPPLSSGRSVLKFMWKSFEFFETKSTIPHQLLVLGKFATYTNTWKSIV